MDPAAQMLDAVLGDLLARTGAQAARVVDGRRGAVVASVGADMADDAADDVATLVRLAHEAAPVAARSGGLDDLMVATRDVVHVLWMSDVPGAFVHVRLNPERVDLTAVRRGLASAVLHRAVNAALPLDLGPSGSMVAPALPPRGSAEATVITMSAVLHTRGQAAAPGPPAPDRTQWIEDAAPPQDAPSVADPLLHRDWSRDHDTMLRIVAGLHRLR